jgi:TolB-like protein/DNA-binding winged helix-turn-helix (wHTH) protein
MQLAHEAALALGGLRVRPATREVEWPGGREVLQPRVMQVLVVLARARGEVVSRDDLIDRCWDGRIVSEDAINFVVAKLRKLAQRTGGFRLETISRVGYRLIAEGDAEAAAQPWAETAAQPDDDAGGATRRRLLWVAAAGAIVAAVGGGGYVAWRLQTGRRRPITIAVLPFDDLAPDSGQRYLALGLAREVRNSLSRVAGLSVIADASSSLLAGKKLSQGEIARRLGADLLLTGAVTERAGAVRISLELIEPKTGVEVWSRTLYGRVDDLFRLLDSASTEALAALTSRVGPDRLRALPALRARNPIVFRNVLEADDLLERSRTLRMVGNDAGGFDAADRAWDLAQASLRIDPNDVGALVAIATLTRNGWTRALAAQPATQAERAAASADVIRRALTSDPNDPAALSALADYYRRFEWRWKEAEALFRRAIAGNPSLIEAHWAYGYELNELGRAKEGLVHAREVFRLDPEDPFRRIALPRLLYTAGERDAALKRYDVELAATPANVFLVQEIYQTHLAEANVGALLRLKAKVTRELWKGRQIPAGIALLMTRIDAAVAALRGAPDRLVALVDADVATYDRAGPHEAATQRGRASIDLLFVYAMEYAWARATGRGLDLLARALAGRSLYYVAALPYGPTEFPEPMRSDPRYAALWRSDPRLAELIESRRVARAAGQSAGPFKRGPDWS